MTKTNTLLIGFAAAATIVAGATLAADQTSAQGSNHGSTEAQAETPAIALKIEVGDVLGLTEADVRAHLNGLGYEVEEIEQEGDEIEFEIRVDGVEYEIDVSVETGAVLEIERDDE